MKKKKIFIGVLLIVLLLACIKLICMYYDYKQEEKRLAQEPYFTEYKLSYSAYRTMANRYWVDIAPYYWWEIWGNLDKEDWPDYSYYTMEATEDTEMVIAVLNYCLFDELMESDLAGREKAEEYGFSEENRITVDGVMSHPKEAVDIMDNMWDYGYVFSDYQDVKKIYDENIVASGVDVTEQIDESTELD